MKNVGSDLSTGRQMTPGMVFFDPLDYSFLVQCVVSPSFSIPSPILIKRMVDK